MIYYIQRMFNAIGNFIDTAPNLRGVNPVFQEIKIPAFNPKKEDTLGSLVKAGLIHKEVRRRLQPLLKPGVKVLDIIKHIEKETIELSKNHSNFTYNKGIGFPCGFSINNCAAHWSPSSNTDIVINENDVIKIDYGVEMNGWIIDSAFTISFNPVYDNLLTAVKEATQQGIKSIGVDVNIKEWSSEIQETMESYEIELNNKTHKIRAIENLGGHNIKNGIIHGGLFLPAVKLSHMPDNQRFTEGVYAVETFGSTGESRTIEKGNATLFRIDPDYQTNYIKLDSTRKFFQKIKQNFNTLPFCDRYIEDLDPKWNTHIDILNKNKAIYSYPPLVVNDDAYTAQYEHTIYLFDNKKINCSSGEDY